MQVVVHRVGGAHVGRHVGQVGQRTHAQQHVVAVHVGQVGVEHQDLGQPVARERQRLGAIFRHPELDAAVHPHGFLEQDRVDAVVLDVEHAQHRAVGRRCRGRVAHARRARVRQRDAHARAGAVGARAEVEFAAHRLREAARDHQPEAAAVDSRRFTPEALEGLEEARRLLRREAGAGVLDGEDDPAFGGREQHHAHPAARPVVLDRVGGDVDQHLARALRIGEHRRLRAHLVAQHHAVLRGARAQELEDGVHQRLQRERPALEGEAVLLDALQIEQVVDQRQQLLARTQHVIGEVAQLRRARALGREAQQLREADHRVERRAHLMADAREELALGAVGDRGGLLVAQRIRAGRAQP